MDLEPGDSYGPDYTHEMFSHLPAHARRNFILTCLQVEVVDVDTKIVFTLMENCRVIRSTFETKNMRNVTPIRILR